MQLRQVPSKPERVEQEKSPETKQLPAAGRAGHPVWSWLREPLVHFLLIGLALFAVHRVINPKPESSAPSNRIELTEDDVRQISIAWMAQGRPAPTPEQMQSLMEAKVHEEVLYREALALGLDKDDTIVKRRLAQKMEFLAEDLSALPEPTSADLKAWFGQNAERFTLQPRTSFRHLYFSPDQRGAQTRTDAEQALAKLSGEPADSQAAAGLADRFMFQEYYGDRSLEQLAKEFGPQFAQALFQLKPGLWQGPIESGYGWHLLWIDQITPGRVPAFEEIEPTVKSEWIDEQRSASKRKILDAMKARYQIVLPESIPKGDAGRARSPAMAAP